MTRLQGLKRWMRCLVMELPLMMTCREVEAFFVDYLDGNLSRRQQRTFDMHMLVCKDCRAYFAAYQRSIQMGKAVFQQLDAPLPEDVPEDLIKAIVAARKAELKKV